MSCSHHQSLSSIIGKKIFKDQCGKCFEDTRSKDGLDICLICCQAFCKGDTFNHSRRHREIKEFNLHFLYLNIKEVQVIDNNQVEEKEITKLAIGKPGGADLEETWETHLILFCYSCNLKIPTETNSTISNMVKYIINSSSASESDTLKAWELEIFPCEHTLTLQQDENVIIKPKNEAKCDSHACAMNSNLWLCLTCGNLGCGRKQYDGTGGNGHGIEHFQFTKHPLAVKTGTITPSGDACKLL